MTLASFQVEAPQNRLDFGHNTANLRAAMLTHAHVDHSGRLSLLVKEGFKGPIHSTPATADLCGIMLKDSAYLMEDAAIHESHYLEHGNGPPHPLLYGAEDIIRAMHNFRSMGYGKKLDKSWILLIFQRSLETPVTSWDRR